MPINTIHVRNFRGLKEKQFIKLKPITMFIGPNSSGKSSCIHALACLSQTLKVPNNTRPLSPDDEFAYVHLGRFIEVMHSKSYSDSILLGLDVDEFEYAIFQFARPAEKRTGRPRQIDRASGKAVACYDFKCTKRTQDIFLDRAEYTVGEYAFTARKLKDGYEVSSQKAGIKGEFKLKTGFIFDESSGIRFQSPEEYFHFMPFNIWQRGIEQELRRTLYLGPFRRSPERRYPTRGADPQEVGSQGEATVTMLANEMVQSRSREHIHQIALWLAILGLGKNLQVSRIARSDLFDVSLGLEDKSDFPIADLGYGVSQVLPVLTQCSFAPKGATLLFEQPELHLHSLAARPLAKVFIETAKQKNAHVIVETHSPELFGQFIREIRAGSLALDDFVAYRVSRKDGCSHLKEIEIDSKTFDVYERWEKGLSSEV